MSRACRHRLPMPRDLKEPEGWRFSGLRKIWLRVKGGGRCVLAAVSASARNFKARRGKRWDVPSCCF